MEWCGAEKVGVHINPVGMGTALSEMHDWQALWHVMEGRRSHIFRLHGVCGELW